MIEDDLHITIIIITTTIITIATVEADQTTTIILETKTIITTGTDSRY